MPKIAVVTGANKGIGFAIVRSLCKKLGASDVVYLTSRNESLGQAAVKQLQGEGLSPAYHQLDITDEESTRRLLGSLQRTHGGIDILINNVGVLHMEPEMSLVEKTERTMMINFFDTLKAYNILSPAVRPHGRIVFVASSLGHTGYRKINDDLKKRFRDAKTEEDVQTLMKKFVSDVKAGNQVKQGWQPGDDGFPSYNTSKLGIITAVKIFGDGMINDPREGILVNSCCPGYVATDMNDNMGKRTIDEGAVTSVQLALLPQGSTQPQGRFMDPNEKIIDFLRKETA